MTYCHRFLLFLTLLSASFKQGSAHLYLPRFFSLKRYDQTEILPDEDRREILRDIKTVYAPEYRPYVNESLNSYISQEKREIRSYNLGSYEGRYYVKRSEEQPTENFLIEENSRQPKNRRSDVWDEPEAIILTDNDGKKNNTTPATNNKNEGKIPFMNETFVEDMNLKELLYTENFISLLSNISSKTELDLLKVVTEIYRTTEESEENKDENLLHAPFSWNNMDDTQEIRTLQGKTMKKYMNPNVDPCTDFYEYACGNWKNFYTIPPDRATYDTFEMVRENLDYMLKGILHDIKEPPMNSTYNFNTNFINKEFLSNDTSDAIIKAKNFYKSCMQENILDKRGDEPLRKILKQLGGWPIIQGNWSADNFDVVWLMARLRLLNNDVLIAQWVGPDMKNSHEYIVHLDQASLGLPAREYYLDDANIKYLRAYKIFILTIANLMGAQSVSAEKDIEDIIQFETQLAEIMASTEERRNISDIYLRTDLAALSLYFPQFSWKDYFSVTLGDDINLLTPVACYCARYIHELIYLLSNTDPRTLQNYLLWRFVRHRTNNLDHRFTEAKQRFYHILFGREKPPPRWQFCIFQVNSNMGMALGSLFVKKYFDQNSKTDTIEMTKDLENAFNKTLSENSWLDEHTKDYARMKLDHMDLKIGYPDFILNETELMARYYDVQIHPDYFFENVLTLLRHTTRVEQRRMGTEVNRTLWSTPPAVVNAYYSRNKNQIMFPAGMLQPPFYNRHFPKALNFGGIGVVIGHEITHGFDDKGRLFDHEGNLHMWWRESSIDKFYEKSQCLIDQYDQYVLPEVRVALDGYLTQGENIADNGGLKQAYKAYEMWLKKNPSADETLPELDLTGRQLFFLNFAQVWCGQQRIEAAESRIKTSVHSPGIFRVIGALSNSQEFSNAYNCPRNSPMNPDYKCIIW